MFKENRILFKTGGPEDAFQRGLDQDANFEKYGYALKLLKTLDQDANFEKYCYALKLLKTAGLSDEDAKKLMNDGTNPYINYLMDVKSYMRTNDRSFRVDKGGLTYTEKGSAIKYKDNDFERAIKWGKIIYPELKRIASSFRYKDKSGVERRANYSGYEALIWRAITERAPVMVRVLRTITSGQKVDVALQSEMFDELGKLQKGVSVRQLLVDERKRKMAGSIVELPEKDGARMEGEDSERAEIESIRRRKFGDVDDRAESLVKRGKNPREMTKEDFERASVGLMDLSSEVANRAGGGLPGLHAEVVSALDDAQFMITSGASEDDIQSMLARRINPFAEKLYKGSNKDTQAAMDTMEDLFDYYLDLMEKYYGKGAGDGGSFAPEQSNLDGGTEEELKADWQNIAGGD